jgi:membrane-bound lytic murein transglycosylase B
MIMFRYILSILMVCLSYSSALARDQPFNAWLDEFKQYALTQSISQDTLDEAFENSKAPLERIIVLDKKQPETMITLDRYLRNTVTPARIEEGREHLQEQRELLTAIGKKYGVQPSIIVALWGIETSYGANTGSTKTIDALATLAYDGRRSEFFRGELISALRILQAEHMDASEMVGSWAGALGQCQFMPSTFLKHAVDYDGDGKHDIWGNQADAFASIANYLKNIGWNADEGWGMEVQIPDGYDVKHEDIHTEKSLREWNTIGIRTMNSDALPNADTMASLVVIGKDDDVAHYLVYKNYKALLQWNRSRFFATAVSTLSDKIAE